MTVEVQRRGPIRPITDLPVLVDPTGGFLEIEKDDEFYYVNQGFIGGADPALQPTGTEVAAYSSEFGADPATWTWVNQGASTLSFALSRAIIAPEAGGAGVNNLRLWGPPTWPVAPFAARVRMLNWSPIAGQGGGLAVYRASNGRIHTPNVYLRNNLATGGFSEQWAVNDWSSVTAINATRYGPVTSDVRAADRFLQVRCDGTTIFFDISVDNARFTNLTSTALATYIGGTGTDLRVLLIGNDPTASANALIGYDWFRVYGNANLNQ